MDPITDHQIEIDPPHLDDPHANRLYDYWRDVRGGRPRPVWAEIDLMAIHDIAPYITVKDVIDGGADFRNRFFGTGLVRILGYDGTGKSLIGSYSGDRLALVLYVCRTSLSTLKPLRSYGQIFWADQREHWTYTCLYLPLDGEAGTPAHLITVFDFDEI